MDRLAICVVLVILSGCENILVNGEIENSQKRVFELLWEDFDRNYAGFTVRSIDWDSVYETTISNIEVGLSDSDFEQLIGQILLSLEDIHVALVTPPNDRLVFDPTNPNSLNSIGFLDNYLENTSQSRVFGWGKIRDTNVGYLYVGDFNGDIAISEFERIDQIIAGLIDTDGLILDLRENSGGNAGYMRIVASRFIEESFTAYYSQFRNGPQHQDLDEPLKLEANPDGPQQYLKPVVILMNRSSQSSAELFVLALEIQDNVITVGDRTAGGMGQNNYRELPNGWNYRLTTTLVRNANFETFEGRGIPPDEFIFISKQDSLDGVDPQLQHAIDILSVDE